MPEEQAEYTWTTIFLSCNVFYPYTYIQTDIRGWNEKVYAV